MERAACRGMILRGHFSMTRCHQEDSARFVDACYQTFLEGGLPSGAHYFVISNNKYKFFDLETPKREIGYEPQHDAEVQGGFARPPHSHAWP